MPLEIEIKQWQRAARKSKSVYKAELPILSKILVCIKIHFYFFTLFDSSILLHSTKNKVTDFLFQNHRKEKVGSKKEQAS